MSDKKRDYQEHTDLPSNIEGKEIDPPKYDHIQIFPVSFDEPLALESQSFSLKH